MIATREKDSIYSHFLFQEEEEKGHGRFDVHALEREFTELNFQKDRELEVRSFIKQQECIIRRSLLEARDFIVEIVNARLIQEMEELKSSIDVKKCYDDLHDVIERCKMTKMQNEELRS